MARHIGILLTNGDTSDFAKPFPNDGDKFRQLLQPLAPDWQFTVVPVVHDVFPDKPEDYDGYVITGSPASVNGTAPWIARLLHFIRALDEKRIPTFGACFGFQAIALALGGKVGKSPRGWGLGTAVTVFSEKAPWMSPTMGEVQLFAAHEEQVNELPASAILLGGSAFCPIGSYRVGNHIFATEFHPEMTEEFMKALIDHLEKYVDGVTIARARASLAHPAEGPAFARWIINFLGNSKV